MVERKAVYAMTVQVGNRVFKIRDQIRWQLLGAEGDCLEMRGRLTAIRVVSDPIGVAVDSNGQAWLVDLAEVQHEHEGRPNTITQGTYQRLAEITEEDRAEFYGEIRGEGNVDSDV